MKRSSTRLFLAILLVLSLVSSISFAQASKEEGLVAHWSFDEGDGTVAKDSSGNSNDGKLMGGRIGVQWVKKGVSGSAVKFNGLTGYIEVPFSESLAVTNKFSLEFWIHPEPPHQDGFGGIMNNIGGGWNTRLLLRENNPNNCLWAQVITDLEVSNIETFQAPPMAIKNKEWSHVVYVFDGTYEYWYVNGKQVAKAKNERGELQPADSEKPIPLYIGWGHNETYHFNGMMDEVKIYNKPLSADEVVAKYNAYK